MDTTKIGVIGAGAWGTAMAHLQGTQGHSVSLWAYEAETVECINRTQQNATFLPNIPLSANITATENLLEVAQNHSILVMATPSHAARDIAQQLAPHITPQHCLVILSKGIEPQSLLLMSQVYQDVLGASPTLAVLSGPNFAKEVAHGQPAAAVLACSDFKTGKTLQRVLSTPTYRLYLSHDVVGVQVGGAVKNVIAIASGICDGMQLGANARAALICRGMAEVKRLVHVLGGKMETLLGLSGMGDLILTATDSLSRNYSLGLALGKGVSVEDYLSQKASVAEGYKNAPSLYELAQKHQIQMPLCEAVYEILYKNLDCQGAFLRLLSRELPDGE